MRVLSMLAVGVVGLGAITFVPGLNLWLAAGSLIAVIGATYWLGRCSHQMPVALLPATVDLHGNMLPPRWYCDRCGSEWPANFEKERKPVQKFTGHDESKAVSAAKRADELGERQRGLALERAGLRPRSTTRRAPSPHRGSVIPIGSRRSVAR